MTQEITTQVVLRGMDSREIAQLTSKEHRNVCRDIQGMLAELQIDRLKFESVYKAGNGEMRRCYVLPKRECLILATGYNVGLRAKIIDRWAELEAAEQARQRQAPVPAPQHKIPQTYADALQLAADQAKQLDSQAKQIQAAQPAVEFVGRYVVASGTHSLRGVAKILHMPEQAFIARLVADKILYRLSGRLMPAADQMHRGHFEVKTGEANGVTYTQPRVTPRGVEYLTRCVARWQRDAQRS